MTGLEIFLMAFLPAAAYIFGYINGTDDGIKEGRRAVRKYYEGLNKWEHMISSTKLERSCKIVKRVTETQQTICPERPIHPHQVAGCMALVKLARSMETGKVDNFIDGAAYFAIIGELQTEENDLYV